MSLIKPSTHGSLHPSCSIVCINISLAAAFWNLFEVDQTRNFHLLLHTQHFLVSDWEVTLEAAFQRSKEGSVCVVHQAALAMLFLVDFCCFLCVVSGAALGRGLGFAKSNLNIFVIASVWRGNRTGKTQLLSWCRSRSNKPVWGGKTINWWG